MKTTSKKITLSEIIGQWQSTSTVKEEWPHIPVQICNDYTSKSWLIMIQSLPYYRHGDQLLTISSSHMVL